MIPLQKEMIKIKYYVNMYKNDENFGFIYQQEQNNKELKGTENDPFENVMLTDSYIQISKQDFEYLKEYQENSLPDWEGYEEELSTFYKIYKRRKAKQILNDMQKEKMNVYYAEAFRNDWQSADLFIFSLIDINADEFSAEKLTEDMTEEERTKHGCRELSKGNDLNASTDQKREILKHAINYYSEYNTFDGLFLEFI